MGRSTVFQSSVANGVLGGSNSLANSINANKSVLFAPKNFGATSGGSFTKNKSNLLMKNFVVYGPTAFILEGYSNKVIKY